MVKSANEVECWLDCDVEFDMVRIDSCMSKDVSRMVAFGVVQSQVFERVSDLLHNMACSRNELLPAKEKQQVLDRHKQLHKAMQQRFAGVYPSYDGFETKPAK